VLGVLQIIKFVSGVFVFPPGKLAATPGIGPQLSLGRQKKISGRPIPAPS